MSYDTLQKINSAIASLQANGEKPIQKNVAKVTGIPIGTISHYWSKRNQADKDWYEALYKKARKINADKRKFNAYIQKLRKQNDELREQNRQLALKTLGWK